MTDLRSLIFTAAEKHATAYPQVPDQHAAILPSELLAFAATCRELGVVRIIESGRRFGYSTEVLATWGFTVVSIDTHPLPDRDRELRFVGGITLITGNGCDWVPRMLADPNYPLCRTAVLLDGPKGTLALALARTILSRVVLVGIHDCFLRETKAVFPRDTFFTDDPEYVERFGEIDQQHLTFRGYERHDQILPVAGVLGILRGGVE